MDKSNRSNDVEKSGAQPRSFVERVFHVREHEMILVALCIVGIVFSLLNPLWYGHAPGFDASVYALFGKMWSHGEVIYQDMIDIKGPAIYFINMIGYRIGGYPGIAFIETLFLVFGMVSVDLALRVFKFSPLSRFCSITTVISLLGLRYYYGNMVEDYAVYLAMIASYPFALLFGMRRFNWVIGLVPALGLAFTTAINFNNGSYFLAWYTMLFLFYCSNGTFKQAVKLAGSAVLTCLFVWGCFIAHFYSIGGEELVHNVLYFSLFIHLNEFDYNSSIPDFAAGFVGFARTGLWIIVLGFVWLVYSRDNKIFLGRDGSDYRKWFMLYLVLGVGYTVVANSLTGHVYDHYDQLFLPFMFIPLAFLMHRYLHVKQDIHVSFLSILFLIVFLVSEHVFWPWDHKEWKISTVYWHAGADALCALLLCSAVFALRKKVGYYRHNHTVFLCLSIFISFIICIYALTIGHTIGTPWDDSTAKKVQIIRENTDINDKIWVDGSMFQYYIWTDRTTASPYLITNKFMAPYDFTTKILNSLNYFHPKYVIIREKAVDEFRENFKAGKLDEYSPQELAFVRFIRNHYNEVEKGLYVYDPAKVSDDNPENTDNEGEEGSSAAGNTTGENENTSSSATGDAGKVANSNSHSGEQSSDAASSGNTHTDENTGSTETSGNTSAAEASANTIGSDAALEKSKDEEKPNDAEKSKDEEKPNDEEKPKDTESLEITESAPKAEQQNPDSESEASVPEKTSDNNAVVGQPVEAEGKRGEIPLPKTSITEEKKPDGEA